MSTPLLLQLTGDLQLQNGNSLLLQAIIIPQGTATYTGYAPTIDLDVSVPVGTGSGTYTGAVPEWEQRGRVPGTGTGAYTGYAPVFSEVTTADLNETAVITASATSSAYSNLNETAVIVARSPLVNDVEETASIVASYAITVTSQIELYESAVVRADVIQTNNAASSLTDVAAVITAAITNTFTVSVNDTAVLDDEVLTDTSTIQADLDETAVITASATADLQDTASETAVISANMANEFVVYATESAVLDDVNATELLTLINAANETAALNDELTASAQMLNTVAVTGYFSDQLLTVGGITETCWTANVVNWAMSRHNDGGIRERTTHFAVSREGLYSVDSTFEASSVTTGHVQFDDRMKKRAFHLYVVGEYVGDLTVTATGEVNGTRASYNYTAKTDTTSSPTTARVDLGRGFHSPYFQFTLSPEGEAALFRCDIPAYPSRRRV